MIPVISARITKVVKLGVFVVLAGLLSSGDFSTTADAAHDLSIETIVGKVATPVFVLLKINAVLAPRVCEAGVSVHTSTSCWAFELLWFIQCQCQCSGSVTTTADAAHLAGDKAIAITASTPVFVSLVVGAVFVPVVHDAIVRVHTSTSCWLFGASAWHAVSKSAYSPLRVG